MKSNLNTETVVALEELYIASDDSVGEAVVFDINMSVIEEVEDEKTHDHTWEEVSGEFANPT